MLEPCYDSYVPNIELAGGTRGARAADARHLPARLRRASPRRSRRARARSSSTRRTTRAARSGRADDMRAPRRAAARRPTCVAHQRRGLRAHGVRRRSAPERGALPGAGGAQRSSSRASARPTTSPAGRSATSAAPAALTAEFRKVHQFNVFTVNTPMQHGLAAYMADPRTYLELPAVLPAQARPVPRRAGGARGCGCCRARARYFQCVDYLGASATSARTRSAAG